MSKRIPVYLNENELKVLKEALDILPYVALHGINIATLTSKVQEQLDTFEEPFSNVDSPEEFKKYDDNFGKKI